ncbi:MAG: hypothetical protein MJA29_10250 [Candidatus Omnitrophica bacterium]|nr:hypothetical protein [Candidatus Omnitrophota bacterium]
MDKLCPHCQSPVYDRETLRCWQCGGMLGEGAGFISKMRYSRPKVIFIACALGVVIAFILLIL